MATGITELLDPLTRKCKAIRIRSGDQHGCAQRRETIAWTKRRQSSAEKLTIFQVWRNSIKRRWEKGPPISSAMLEGLTARLLDTDDLLAERLFRTRVELTGKPQATSPARKGASLADRFGWPAARPLGNIGSHNFPN